MKFDESLVRLDVHADDAVHAITLAGQLLVDAGRVTPAYVDAMVEAYRSLGPYVVLAPHIAMPHARPEAGALAEAIAVVRLAEPVEFGHVDNDPVRVVIPLAGVDAGAHIDVLRRLSAVLMDPHAMTTILETDDPTEIVGLFTTSEA
jgi:mannitol/fructose-specific phosphotransferase system IIA component (Ntr-type)